MFNNLLNHPVLQGAGAVGLLEVIPHQLGLQTVAQMIIVAVTAIVQIFTMLKKKS